MIEFDRDLGSEIMNPTSTSDVESTIDDDDDDRISQLPICILRIILLHLPLKEEARTCVLSKFWNTHVCLPQRGFDFSQNRLIGDDLALYTNESQLTFLHSVEDSLRVLHDARFILHYLRLVIRVINPDVTSCIDRWIRLVASEYLGSLYLHVSTIDYLVDLYRFPNMELASVARRIRVIRLSGCKLLENSLCDCGDEPLAVEILYLYNVKVDNRGGGFQKFISRCTSLRKLVLQQCMGVKVLRLVNHPQLVELNVDVKMYAQGKLLKRIEVDSLNLRTITCSGNYNLVPLIVKATRCKNLIRWDISSTRLNTKFFENLGTDFPCLRTLCLRGCKGPPESCTLRHPLLRTLELNFNNLKQLLLETPKLHVFKYRDDKFPESDPPCASPLKEFYHSLTFRRPLNTLSFIQLRDYLTKFNTSYLALSLHIRSTAEFNMDEVTTLDPPRHVQFLKVGLHGTSVICTRLFEGLFWSCHPKYLCVKSKSTLTSVSLEFMCEILTSASKEDFDCCKSQHLKCWRHFLKEATIRGIDSSNMALPELESVLQQRLAAKRNLHFALTWSE